MSISSRPIPQTCRLTDEYHSIPERVAQASTTLLRGQGEQHRFPPPAFVTDIVHLPGVLALPENFLAENGFLIRTWYLHHTHFPCWIVPRFVELNHEWQRWQSEIAGAWRDMIVNHESVHFHTVMPDPDRSYIPRQVLADVIVSQDEDDEERFAGLLTVFQQDAQGHRRPYALAISLPEDVSGVGIAQIADITHICNSAVCHFYFGWNRIPYSLAITHQMLDGHGFVGHVTPPVRQQTASSAQSSQSGQLARDATTNQAASNRRPREHDASDLDFDEGQDQLTDTSIPNSLTQFEHWQGLQVYRLGRPMVHCFVRWGTYNVILHEVAHFLGEHLRNLTGIHHVQCALVGQHEAEESIILQHVGDLPLGSTEQLVILDVEVHFQTLPAGLLRAPEVTRRVHRAVPQFTRAFVLRLARLSNYCFLQGDRCLVYFNLELWAEQDTRVRSVQHGTYLRVVATPPLDSSLSTEVALNFAISVDEDEATTAAECTAQPRVHNALALHQTKGMLRTDVVVYPGLQSPAFGNTGSDLRVDALDLQLPAQRALSVDTYNDQPIGWRSQLAKMFNTHGFVECTEEGFVAYITTWFVDHLHNPRCDESRPVRLAGTDIEGWQAQIVEVWNNKILPDVLLDIRLILPQPPQTGTETTLAHLILEQNRASDTHSAGVISEIRQDRRHAALRHLAVSISRLTSYADILRQVRLQGLCVLRTCIVTCRRGLMRQGDLEDLDSGFGVIVQVLPISHTGSFPYIQEQLPLWAPAMAAAMDAYVHPEENGVEDNVSFLQTLPNHRKVYQNDAMTYCNDAILACKPGQVDGNDELPMTFPGPDLPRRRRPRHDGREDWIPTLWHTFQTHGVRGTWDNELTIQVTTWYIHHNQRTTCRRPREIQLNGNPVTWIDDLRHAWIDIMDHRRPFSIWVIQPRTPQFQVHPSACHILLEQGNFDRHVAVVLTALMEGHSGDGFIQGAFSTPAEIDVNAAVHIMELAFFCTHRRCRLFRDGQVLDQTAEVRLNSGASLCIRMGPPLDATPPSDPTEQLHFEDLSLMQTRNGFIQSPAANAPSPSAPACFLNPNTQVFQSDRLNIWLYPEYIQTLHDEFVKTSIVGDSEEAATVVQVWLLTIVFIFRPAVFHDQFCCVKIFQTGNNASNMHGVSIYKRTLHWKLWS